MYFANCCSNSCAEQSHKDGVRKGAVEEQLRNITIHPAMRVQLHLLLITDLFLVLEPAPRGGFRYRPATPNRFAAFGNIWLDANGTFSATDNFDWWKLYIKYWMGGFCICKRYISAIDDLICGFCIRKQLTIKFVDFFYTHTVPFCNRRF